MRRTIVTAAIAASLTVAPVLGVAAQANAATPAPAAVSQVQAGATVVTASQLAGKISAAELAEVLRVNGKLSLQLSLLLKVNGLGLGGAVKVDARLVLRVLAAVDFNKKVIADLIVKAGLGVNVSVKTGAELQDALRVDAKIRAAVQAAGVNVSAIVAVAVDASGKVIIVTR